MAETVNSTFMAQPAGSEDLSLGNDRIISFKLAWKERMEKEHHLDLTEAGSQPRQGLHKAGSAVAFHQASAPTTRNGNALGSADAGILFVQQGSGKLQVYNGSAFYGVIPGDYAAVNCGTTTVFSALAYNTKVTFTATCTGNFAAGAANVGTRLRIAVSSSYTATISVHTGVTFNLTDNEIEFEWDGSSWILISVKNPVAILTADGTSADTTGTFTAPFSGDYQIEVVGGGAGGGAGGGSSYGSGGAGGGAGALVAGRVYIAKGTAVSYTAGKYGAGATVVTAAGASGGDSVFGSYATAAGGSGGYGKDASSYENELRGGAGGTPTAASSIKGAIAKYGNPGHSGYYANSTSVTGSAAGNGGTSPYDNNSGRGFYTKSTPTSIVGETPAGIGGGGGGGVGRTSSPVAGGAGAPGRVRVWIGRTF